MLDFILTLISIPLLLLFGLPVAMILLGFYLSSFYLFCCEILNLLTFQKTRINDWLDEISGEYYTKGWEIFLFPIINLMILSHPSESDIPYYWFGR